MAAVRLPGQDLSLAKRLSDIHLTVAVNYSSPQLATLQMYFINTFALLNFIPQPTHPTIRRTSRLTVRGLKCSRLCGYCLNEACLNAGTVVDNDEKSEDSDDDLADIGC